jgi:hypothetical protein
MQAIMKIESDRPDWQPDLSEQDLLSCSGAGGCNGGYIPFNYIQSRGVLFEKCFKYVDEQVPCSAKYLPENHNEDCNWNERVSIEGYGLVIEHFSGDYPERWQKALIKHGPLLSMLGYGDGTYHALTINGWRLDPDAPGGGYWIIGDNPDSNPYARAPFGASQLDFPYFLYMDYKPNHKLFLDDPVGGEHFFGGTACTIEWNNENLEGNIEILYSTDNGETYPNQIAIVPVSDGSYEWQIPNIDSSSCKLLIQSVNDEESFHLNIAYDESNTFTINSNGDDDDDSPSIFDIIFKFLIDFLRKIFTK